MKAIKKRSMKQRIIKLVLLYSFIYTISVITVIYISYRDKTYNNVLEQYKYNSDILGKQINSLLNNIKNSANNVVLNLNSNFDNGSQMLENKLPDVRKYQTVRLVLDFNMLLFPDISSIDIVLNNGDVYSHEKYGTYKKYHVSEEILKRYEAYNPGTKGVWIANGEEERICFLKQLNRIDTNKPVGFIVLYIKERTMYKAYENMNEDLQYVYILDQNERLVSSNERENMQYVYQAYSKGEEYQIEESKNIIDGLQKNRKYQYIQVQLNDGWKMLTFINISKQLTILKQILAKLIIVGVIINTVMMIISYVILNGVMKPIVLLARRMEDAKKKELIEIPGIDDEIDYLIDSFNKMVIRNQQLMEEIKKEEKEKRYIELALIQAQIKPHFLYNTLDTAYCLNEIGENAEASYVIKALADYYRLVLNKGRELISLSEELAALRQYLNIQSVRYGDLMEYHINMDEELLNFQIPKMTLQPLVENAIYHGIKPARRKGHILIMGELTEKELTISVVDDGIGMTQKQFEQMICNNDIYNTKSFGLKSTVDRLHLFYGDAVNVSIQEAEIGTHIEIEIQL